MGNELFNRFTFTYLRPTDQCVSLLRNIRGIILCFYGDEIGPVSKVRHLQGYFETKGKYSLFALKKKLPGFYLEPAKFTREANYAYCSKSGPLTVVVSTFDAMFVDPLDKIDKIVYNIKRPSKKKKSWIYQRGVRGVPTNGR